MLRTRSPRKEKISNCYLHSNSLSNKMDNSLLAVRDINHKYIVVALGAKNTKKQEIVFISEAHEKFYYEKLKEVRYLDVGVSQSLCKPPN